MLETRSSLLVDLRDPANAAAWAEFVALYEPLLMAYVRRRGLDEHRARDVVQDILVQLINALPSFRLDRGKGRFRSWLWAVAHNALLNRARKERRRDRAEGGWVERMMAASPSESCLWEAEWGEMHHRRVLDRALEVTRSTTRGDTWACFERHLRLGRPAAEVAAELGLSVGAVYVNASRVLKRVRERCAESLETIGDDDPE